MQLVQPDTSVFRNAISELLNGGHPLPSLPAIAIEIRHAVEQQDLSLGELSKLLGKDPGLSDVLLRYASSPLIGSQTPPHTLLDVVRLLGMNQVERIALVYSIKKLFTANSVKHKRLFTEAWRRLASKASLSTYIAKQLHLKQVSPDKALMAALLSELGALGVLSALTRCQQAPDLGVYIALCREYAKTLGIMTLRGWDVDQLYIDVVQGIGRWTDENPGPMDVLDTLNLGLYHAVKLSSAKTDLPPLQTLTAYQKLEDPSNKTIAGGLALVMTNIQEVRIVTNSLF